MIGDGVGGIAGCVHLVIDVDDGGEADSVHFIDDGDGVGGIAGAAHSEEVGGVVWRVGSTHRISIVDAVVSGVALGVGGASVGFTVGVC